MVELHNYCVKNELGGNYNVTFYYFDLSGSVINLHLGLPIKDNCFMKANE